MDTETKLIRKWSYPITTQREREQYKAVYFFTYYEVIKYERYTYKRFTREQNLSINGHFNNRRYKKPKDITDALSKNEFKIKGYGGLCNIWYFWIVSLEGTDRIKHS
jgi:hypothetical protein